MPTNRVRKERIAENAHRWQLPLGDTLLKDLSERDYQIPDRDDDPEFWNFLHALNTSDWLAACYFLFAGESQNLQNACGKNDTLCCWMAKQYLKPLYQAAERFDRDRKEWQGELQEAYQFGKLPAYGPRTSEIKKSIPTYASNIDVVQHGRKLTRLIPICQEYEKVNQLYQQPGRTVTGAPIRFTQGHNWSYSHASMDMNDERLFPKTQKCILVNWDAHRDLSSPFRHLSGGLAFLTEWLQIDKARLLGLMRHGKTREELAEVSSMMSIAGWIIPLLYSRHLAGQDISEVILIVPREALETSEDLYWPDYGTYSIGVGYTSVDFEDFSDNDRSLDTDKLTSPSFEKGPKHRIGMPVSFQNHLKNNGWKSLQTVSSAPQLQTIPDELAGFVKDIHDVKIHIMDPDHLDLIQKNIGDASIYLSVDVDYAGTTQLGGLRTASNPTPHYPLNRNEDEESRHQQLIDDFQTFYQRNAKKIRSVSVANSPDYTADETRRRPAAKIFEILTANTPGQQPNWISGESNRLIPPQLQKHSSRHLLIPLAGVLGISITGALLWHFLRSREIRADSEK